MKRVIEILTLLPWLAPYALLAVGYLFLLYLSGLHFPLLLVLAFPVMMFIFVMLHSRADMTLDLELLCFLNFLYFSRHSYIFRFNIFNIVFNFLKRINLDKHLTRRSSFGRNKLRRLA
jgi:hypothetical protein